MLVLADISLRGVGKTPTSDTESQRRRKKKIMIDNIDPENREIKRRLPLSDVPEILRQGDGSQLSEILRM